MGRENLSTSGWMNELTHALWTKYTRSVAKLMAGRMGLDNTMVQYLAVWQAMASVHIYACTFENHANYLRTYLAN